MSKDSLTKRPTGKEKNITVRSPLKENRNCAKSLGKLFFCLIFFVSITQLYASESRFHRLIRLYSNYNYLEESRDIFFKYGKVIHEDDTIIDENYDIGIYDDDNNNFFLSYQSRKHQGEALREKRRVLTAAYNNFNLTRENTAGSSGSSPFLDTLHQLFEINGRYDLQLSKYLTEKTGWKYPFWHLSTIVNGSMAFKNKKGFDQDLEGINSPSLKWDWIEDKRYSSTILTDVTPALCLGRQISTTPVYHALKLEKKLIEDSIVSARLSDETILAIAQLFATKERQNTRNIAVVNEFKRELDSIMVKDSAVEKNKLRYISPLDIDNIVFCKRHAFMSKPRLRLFSTSRLRLALEKHDIKHPYNIDTSSYYDPRLIDANYTENSFRYEHLLGLDIEWGIPLTLFLFLNIRGYRNLLSTEREVNFISSDSGDNNILWDEVLDIRWDYLVSVLVANGFVVQAGVDNLPAWIVAPREHPHHYFLNLNIYIEDYLSFKFTTSYYHSGELYQSYYDWSDPFIWLNRGFALSMTVTYNFRK